MTAIAGVTTMIAGVTTMIAGVRTTIAGIKGGNPTLVLSGILWSKPTAPRGGRSTRTFLGRSPSAGGSRFNLVAPDLGTVADKNHVDA